MTKDITVLVHGFNKNKGDMAYIEKGLSEFGFKTISVNLPTTFGTLEDCRNSLYLQTNEIVNKYERVNYVAHSMGGLITRSYINYIRQDNVDKCVFIATPHKGSKLAEIANYIPLYSTIFRPVKDLLPNCNLLSFSSNKDIKIGLIAGDKNRGVLRKLFLSSKSDGRVEVSSVKTEDADEFIMLPFDHKEIHHKSETLIFIKRFLLTGTFTIKRH